MSFYSAVLFTTNSTESKRQLLTKKVHAMATLPPGFSHGEGVPVREPAIACAENLILLASQLKLDADVFPNTDGGCAVAFYRNEERVEASISPDGDRFDLRVEHGIGFQFEDVVPPMENAGINQVINEVLKLWIFDEDIWKLYESSTSASLTEEVDDSGILPTETHQGWGDLILQMVKGGSQSSRLLAPA